MRSLAIIFVLLAGCTDLEAPAIGERSAALEVDIAKRLASLPGVWVYEHPELVPKDMEGYRYLRLYVEQRVDHFNPRNPGTFIQRIALLHHDDRAPVVLSITGYGINTDLPVLSEPARLVGANQFYVEHRGTHGSPLPSWEFHTSAQAAADLHTVVGLFDDVYPRAPWVSTGVSKGGVESLIHRHFYPSDVVGTVAYVAPAMNDFFDPRFVSFFDTIPTEACTAALEAYQHQALDEAGWRPALRDALDAMAPDMTFERVGTDRALASAVLAVGWDLFQNATPADCDGVPGPDATADEAAAFLAERGLFYLSDVAVERYEQFAYQQALELGYPDVPRDHLADVLGYDQEIIFPEEMLPAGTSPAFSSDLLLSLEEWTGTHAERLLLIYGENDPWSWVRYEVSPALGSARFTARGANHGARIADLADAEGEAAAGMIESWSSGH